MQAYIASALMLVLGLVGVVFRTRIARKIIRQHQWLYDHVPTFFAPKGDQSEQRLRVHTLLITIAGVAFVASGVMNLWELLRR